MEFASCSSDGHGFARLNKSSGNAGTHGNLDPACLGEMAFGNAF